MSSRMDWRRARNRGAVESVLGSDVEMRDGSRTPRIAGDKLSRRADRAMDQWLRALPAHVKKDLA
jgi:hypothetical protein